jgi:HPt (histidine-containing phosphotransfer) domain-containing protein
VALTANAVVGQADTFLKNGFDDFISKPIDVRQLNATLNKLVRDKQPAEVLKKAEAEKESVMKLFAISANLVSPELLSVFVRDANKTLPILESAAKNIKNLSDDEMRLFTTSVHGMKSALKNIGETRLAQMAYALENAGKINNRDSIYAQIHNFIKALRGVTAKAEVESKTKDNATVDENPGFLREQLLVIAQACQKYDERGADDALDKLKKMAWTEKTEEILGNIAEMLLHSNFDEAAEYAKKMSGQQA